MINSEWTKLILEPGRDWDEIKRDCPVVKMTARGFSWFGVLGALLEIGGVAYVTEINDERSEQGGSSCLMGPILLSRLASGEIEIKDGTKLEISFDGLASDTKHRGRRWSYWF